MGEAKRRRMRGLSPRGSGPASVPESDEAALPSARASAEAAGTRTKKQHYNPRLHLKRFTNDSGKLHVYDKFTDRTFVAGIDNVGHENHFLSFPELDGDQGAGAFFEGFFGPAEDAAAPIIEDILARLDVGGRHRVVSAPAKGPLARFLALQQLRTKVSRSRAADSREAMSRVLAELRKEGFRGTVSDPANRNGPVDAKTAHAEQLLIPGLVDRMAEALLGHVWYVFANGCEAPLYTSDHPLSFRSFAESDVRGSGPASYGAELQYPLSPRYQLTLVERRWAELHLRGKVHQDGSLLGVLEPANLEYQRSLQVSGSFRFVYAPVADFALARDMCERDPSLRRPPESGIVVNYGGRRL